MFKNKMNYKLLNVLMFCAIMYLVLITFDKWVLILRTILNVVFPFLIAFIVAYALSPLVRLLQKKGVRKNLAVTIVVLGVVLIFGLILYLTVPLIYEQLVTLSKNIGTLLNDSGRIFDIDITEYKATIMSYLNEIISSIGTYISNGFISFISQSINFLTKFIIVFIVTIYFMGDMENIRKTTKSYLKKTHKRAYKLVRNIDNALCHYLEGLLIFMIIQFFEYSFLFWIVGHPYWILLGFLASITTVIPYFGGWITNITAVILASVISPQLFVATLIICFIFPNIDGYIISPRIYGKTNNVKPLWSIFAVTVMGGLLGLFGILFSMPTYLVLNCIYQFFKEDIKDKIEGKEKEA